MTEFVQDECYTIFPQWSKEVDKFYMHNGISFDGRMINKLTGNPTPVDLRPARDWDRSGKRFGSTKKSQEKLGFMARTSVSEGLRRTVEWTMAYKETIVQSIYIDILFISQADHSK